MNRLSITRTIENTIAFLKEDAPFVMDASTAGPILARTEDLLEKSRSPGEVLYVGILGGTGVGKSTLINALARKEISNPSDRRPYTDKAVVYRHKSTPRGLDQISGLLRDSDALHESDDVKALVLLDLPDFDSVKDDHRSAVTGILPLLDCVVWVVSPEKYADRVFYRWVRETSINRDNFTFVLNKGDELITDDRFGPHARMKDVLGDFTFRLKEEATVEEPRVFMLSALQEFTNEKADPVLSREFGRFRDFLMVRRDAKEIGSIKTVNLAEETRLLLSDINEKVNPTEKAKLIETILGTEKDFSGAGQKLTSGLMEYEQNLGSSLFRILANEDSSIGPVRLATRLLGSKLLRENRSEHSLARVFGDASDALGKDRILNLETLGARMDSELSLHFGSGPDKRESPDPGAVMARASAKAFDDFAEIVEIRKNAMAGTRGKLRRLGQKLVLLLPVPFLLARLVGHGRIESWADNPSLGGFINLVAGCFMSLFGSEGLTGLVVLLICEVLLIWYLASRRSRKLRKSAASLARSALGSLDRSLKAAHDREREARKMTLERLGKGVRRLLDLEQGFAGFMAGKDHKG